MENVLNVRPNRRFWKIILFGQIDDIDEVRKNLELDLKQIWIGFSYDGDDDEVIATLNLYWVDSLEVARINERIIQKNNNVEIIHNGEVAENDKRDRIRTWRTKSLCRRWIQSIVTQAFLIVNKTIFLNYSYSLK